MSISSEITRLQGVKSDILQAISDKGVTVPDGSALADCPELTGLIGTNLNVQEYDYKVLTKYSNYFSPHLKNLKSCSNGMIQLEGSVNITASFTPHYDPSDGTHSSNSWPLLFYFENVDYLQEFSNQNALFIKSDTSKFRLLVIEIEPTEKKVYVRIQSGAIESDYYHLFGTFIS